MVVYDAYRFLAGDSPKTITRFIPTIPQKLEVRDPNYSHNYAVEFDRLVTTTQEGYRRPSVGLIKRMVYTLDLYKNKKQLLRFLVLVENIGKKELISFAGGLKGCQIDHIMPQALTFEWNHVSRHTHERYLHTLGNLSITYDNQNLSNKNFTEKKNILAEKSLIKLNKMLLDYDEFAEEEIRDRGYRLIEKFCSAYGIDLGSEEEIAEGTGITTQSPQEWLARLAAQEDEMELAELCRSGTNWKAICDHLDILVGADSAHRRLEKWIKHNIPLWPSTYP